MSTITVAINDKIMMLARNCSNTIIKRLPPRDNYTELEANDRYYIGYLGEFAFEEALRSRGKKAIHNIILNGASAGEDFTCFFKIGPKKIDVKTASMHYAKGMAFPKSQYNYLSDKYIYVGVKLDNGYAHIMGWCLFSDMNKDPQAQRSFPIPTNFIHYTEMQDIDELIKKMEDGQTVINYYE